MQWISLFFKRWRATCVLITKIKKSQDSTRCKGSPFFLTIGEVSEVKNGGVHEHDVSPMASDPSALEG